MIVQIKLLYDQPIFVTNKKPYICKKNITRLPKVDRRLKHFLIPAYASR